MRIEAIIPIFLAV